METLDELDPWSKISLVAIEQWKGKEEQNCNFVLIGRS